jgi:hypothetical protein
MESLIQLPDRRVLESTRGTWRRAYERQPATEGERALLRAAKALAELESERLEGERLQPLPGPPVLVSDKQRSDRPTVNGRGARPRLAGRAVWPNQVPQ